MKSTIILSVLATICLLGIGAAMVGITAISRLKGTTQSTTNDLTRYGNKLTFDLGIKLSNVKIAHLQRINEIVNPTMADIRTMISTANANGKNAEHCYEPARKTLNGASTKATQELENCAKNGMSLINPVKNNIDATILLGNQIVNQLDAILLSCYSANSMQMDNCIIRKIADASAGVQALQRTADELKRTGDATSLNAVTTSFSCSLRAPETVRVDGTSVRIEAQKCIDNA